MVATFVSFQPSHNQVEAAEEALAELDGISRIEATRYRAGDNTGRSNAFITVHARNGLSADETDHLANAISHILAPAQASTRVMVELVAGDLSVGVSPVPELNPFRLDLARTLSSIDGVVQTSVLWGSVHSDNLIVDDDNAFLSVFVQAETGTPLNPVDPAVAAIDTALAGTLDVIVLNGGAPRTSLYRWEQPEVFMERSLRLDLRNEFSSSVRRAVAQLDGAPGVNGYWVSEPFLRLDVDRQEDAQQILRSIDTAGFSAGVTVSWRDGGGDVVTKVFMPPYE
jgi:hypothetical protein